MMPDRRLLSDVADAVAARQEVDWERCAERALPAQRRPLDHLRTFAGICLAAGGPAVGAGTKPAADFRGSRFARRAVGLLVAVALLQSAVGLATGVVLLPAATEGMLASLVGSASARGFLPVADMSPPAVILRIVPHVLYPVCGLVLFLGGRFDRRARLLGAVLVLLGAFWAQPVVGGLGAGLYPELFLPAVLWMFVREFPQIRRRTWLDDAATVMVVIAATVGGVVQAANLPPVQALVPSLAMLAREVPGAYVSPAFFGPHCVLVLVALVVLVLRARGVASGARRRTGLFVAGLVAALAPHVEGVVEAAFPGTVTVAAANWVAVLGSVSALAVPCLTMYAAIVLRVLDVRTTVRVSARRLLTRGGLAVLTAGPLAVLGGLVASRSNRPVGEALADPLAWVCLAAAGAAVVGLVFRERLLARLDAWVAPETADQRRVLAASAANLGQASRLAEVETVVARAARQGAGVPAALLVADVSGGGGHEFAAPGGSPAPLPRTSAIVHVVEQVRAPIEVHPDVWRTSFELLPREEAAWVVAAAAAVVAPVAGSGAALAGVLVAGRRADGGRLRQVDLAFLAALAAVAGLALERLRLEDGPAGRAVPPAARACRECGRVVAAADAGARCDACGGAWDAAAVPAVLGGRLVVERRIGVGGMGTVYLARDLGLDRPVAVKTLDGVSSARLARLKTEAQALAALAHPGIAQIHGLETWRGRPLLVMEHLGGGTLAARVARGPLAAADALAVALAVAEALAAVHAAGYRHGDVKPSNIGLTASGAVKLLDFGLAEPSWRGGVPAGGTPPYLSPEVLGGAPAGPADDVWALAVVLYEMTVGRRPFAGATVAELAGCIRRRSLAPPPAPPSVSGALLAFAGGLLTAPLPLRPASAEAFAVALRELVPLTPGGTGALLAGVPNAAGFSKDG